MKFTRIGADRHVCIYHRFVVAIVAVR